VEQEDEIGLTFSNMQSNFIKSLANGKFSEVLADKKFSSKQTKL